MNNLLIIGLGHKARQGKDWVANYLAQKEYANFEGKPLIMKFADALYQEVQEENAIPLLRLTKYAGIIFLSIRGTKELPHIPIKLIEAKDCIKAVELMSERGIKEYWRMEGKDSEFLQLWGTDIRRNFWGRNYWVNKLRKKLLALERETEGQKIIFITDVRFKNEYNLIKEWNGYYVDVVRLSEDGAKRFIAPDRNPQHESETELDDVIADATIIAKSGDLQDLAQQGEDILNKILAGEIQ